MTRAETIMAGVGAVAMAGGAVVLGRSFLVPAGRAYGRRIGGMMVFSLGLILLIFSYGLSHA